MNYICEDVDHRVFRYVDGHLEQLHCIVSQRTPQSAKECVLKSNCRQSVSHIPTRLVKKKEIVKVYVIRDFITG